MRGVQYLTGKAPPMQVEYFQIAWNGNELQVTFTRENRMKFASVWKPAGLFVWHCHRQESGLMAWAPNPLTKVLGRINSGFPLRREYAKNERVLSSGILRRVVCWKSTDVSEEYVASIFRAKEYAKQETSSAYHMLPCWFLAWLILWRWRWKLCVPSKRL
jgi:hypothetical protein